MFTGIEADRLTVLAVCVLGAGVYLRAAIAEGGLMARAVARYAVALVAIAIAILLVFRLAAPVISYSVLCLALISVYAVDLLEEERARRLRVASLAPRAAAEAAPAAWILVAAASPFMLTPYLALKEQVAAALTVWLCSWIMAAIAWRLATAPVRLAGKDVALERLNDRVWRYKRAGVTAVLAVGIVFVFTSFVNAGLPAATPLQRTLTLLSMLTWIVLWAWEWLYVHRIRRSSRAQPS